MIVARSLAARAARPSPARRTRWATSSLRPSSAGTIAEPAGEMPSTSNAIAIVLAVNWPPQAPAPGEAAFSSSCSSSSVILPGGERADGLEHLLDRHLGALEVPGRIEPP